MSRTKCLTAAVFVGVLCACGVVFGEDIVVGFDDLGISANTGSWIPANYIGKDINGNIIPGIKWYGYKGWYGYASFMSDSSHPDWSEPLSGENYAFNKGSADTIGFSFDPDYFPEAQLIGAYFTHGYPSPTDPTMTAERVRFAGYDSEGERIAETNWLELADGYEHLFLDAIDNVTGEYFVGMDYIEIEFEPFLVSHQYSMDDLIFNPEPVVEPVADAGGPYVQLASDWDGADVSLSGTNSSDPLGRAIVAYEWDLDLAVDSDSDGDPANDWTDAGDPNVTAFFPLGQTEIALRVTNDENRKSEPAITTVTISICDVEIDIYPGKEDNTIILNSRGVLPVAFLSTAEFDAATINPMTVTLKGLDFNDGLVKVWGRRRNNAIARMKDVDGDGDDDMTVMLDIGKLAEHDLDALCEIGALTYEGYVVSGVDTLTVKHRKTK